MINEILQLPISDNLEKLYSEEQKKEIIEYLSEMTEDEKIAYKIAFQHLGTSFNVYRSNGFINWKKNKK
jgi:predicted nucleic acid-binding protein